MATLGGTMLTLADLASRTDPNGMPAQIAELLHQSAPILSDIPWQPSNLPTGNQGVVRTGLPTVSLRRLNEGVASSKSTTAQIVDGMSMIEAWSTTDEALLRLSPNPTATRMSEAEAFIEAMGQKATELFFYGDMTEDEKEFNGFEPRYNSTTGNVADNLIDAGGDNAQPEHSSIWLIGWSPNKVYGIYPKGSVGGLRHKDHGLSVIQDPAGTGFGSEKMSGFIDQWCWDCGLVVKDWRYVARVHSIDMDELVAGTNEQDVTDFGTNIIYRMISALHRIPNLSACRPVFYCTRTVMEMFDIMTTYLANSNIYRTKDANGAQVTMLRDVPIKVCDQLLDTETAV